MMDAAYLHWLFSVPIGATIATFGLIGNILSIIVWYRITQTKSRGNQSTAMFFIALAVCDNALLVSFLVHDTLPANHPELMNNYYYVTAYAWCLFPMFFFMFVSSIWMLVGITVNRFVMIAFPINANQIYTRVRTKLGIFGILLFAFCVNFPHFFTYKVDEKDGKYQLIFTEFGHSDASMNYEFWAHCMLLVLVPWFTIAILNVGIVYKCRQQTKKFDIFSKELKPVHMRRERQITKMLLAATFTFLFLLLWQCITQCFWLRFGKHDLDNTQWQIIDNSYAVAKLGAIINASVNWCLYCVASSMFRKRMRLLLGFRIRLPKSSDVADLS